MAYFRCTTGGSGKGNTLVVTCADDLAGATITCTNGTKTYTKTCPSTSPYEVTFYGLMAGTWTVSATVSGNTYTTTVVITDYEAELGGFSWRRWVDTASQLDSTDYASLSEVLADEEAVRELCLEHACVDYMAGITTANADVETIINTDLFAKWVNNSDYALDFLHANEIIVDYMDEADKYGYGEWVITDNTTTPPTWGAKGNVPIMTANNAPYGEAFSSTNYTDSYPWWAFGVSAYSWQSALNSNNGYVGYKFTNPVCVKKVHYRADGIRQSFTYEIRGSNTGNSNDWHTLYSGSYTYSSSGDIEIEFDIPLNDNNEYYLYYCMYGTANRNTSFRVSSLQFYGRELKPLIAPLLSTTSSKGVASADSFESDTYKILNAFDGNESTRWNPGHGSAATQAWLMYEFNSSIELGFIRILATNLNGNRITHQGTLEVYRDGDWETVSDSINFGTNTNNFFFEANYSDVTKMRVKGTRKVDGSYGYWWEAINTFEAYGKDYSEKEFEEGTTKKWLYDHGVELEPVTLRKGSASGNSVTKENQRIHLKNGTTNQSAATYSAALWNIDFTDYSLIRVKFDANLQIGDSSHQACGLYISNSDSVRPQDGSYSDNYIAHVLTNNGSAILPYNLSLGCASVNQSAWLLVSETFYANYECTFNELWLE